MIPKCGVIGTAGLQFYGKICASISHVIKNALGIIQEHSGPLDDFAMMAEEGIPVESERVKNLTGKIQCQIKYRMI